MIGFIRCLLGQHHWVADPDWRNGYCKRCKKGRYGGYRK